MDGLLLHGNIDASLVDVQLAKHIWESAHCVVYIALERCIGSSHTPQNLQLTIILWEMRLARRNREYRSKLRPLFSPVWILNHGKDRTSRNSSESTSPLCEHCVNSCVMRVQSGDAWRESRFMRLALCSRFILFSCVYSCSFPFRHFWRISRHDHVNRCDSSPLSCVPRLV